MICLIFFLIVFLGGAGGGVQRGGGTETAKLSVTLNRDAKTYEPASNACVNLFLSWVKSAQNFTAFCR